eukprot:1471768-Rhodomonas_salina.2
MPPSSSLMHSPSSTSPAHVIPAQCTSSHHTLARYRTATVQHARPMRTILRVSAYAGHTPWPLCS